MIQRYRLSNGIEVVSEPMENRRTVSMGVFIKVGSANETRETNGLSHLIEHMLFKGTKKHSIKEIADITVRIGDYINAYTSKECTALYGTTTTENLREMVGLLGDLLTGSLMDEKELAKEKRVVMDEIDMYADSPEDLAYELLQKRIWREDSLGYLISGTKKAVRGFKKEQMEQFMKKHYYAGNMVVSVAGGYREEEMLPWLEEAFWDVRKVSLSPDDAAKKLRSLPGLALEPYHPAYPPERELTPLAQAAPKTPRYFRSFVTKQKDIEQLYINLAFPAIDRKDGRNYAFSIMNSAFGGSNNSRLFQKIREEEGMAYSISSYGSAYWHAGLFYIDITVQPNLAVQLLQKTIGIIREFVENGISEEELSMYKQQACTELIMAAEGPRTRMEGNAKCVLAGNPLYSVEERIEKLDKVTCEDVRKLAAECIDLKQCSICIVGDQNGTDIRSIKRIWNSLQ